jgi:hypothetical protein
MANTYTAIATVTVGSGGAANIEFTSIPATYTDLVVYVSARFNNNTSPFYLYFNGSGSNYSDRRLTGNGAAASSNTSSTIRVGNFNGTDTTSNTFSSHFIYIPNYAASTNKSVSVDSVSENNATTAYAQLIAGLWSDTAVITSIKLQEGTDNFVQYSTATLYGIKNS